MKMKKVVTQLIIVIIFILSLTGFSATTISAAGENWLSGWANRIQITIDQTKVDANLTNFPVLVHLSAKSGLNQADVSAVFDKLTTNNNRKKIAVTTSDGITQCYVEISYWSDADEQAALWVKVPGISSSTNTILYLYYDAAHADNTDNVGDTGSSPAQKVWDSNYVAVWHLVESGNGTSGEYKDSTVNAHNGTGGNGNASQTPARVIDELGLPAQSFSGDYIVIPDANGFSIPVPGGFTCEDSFSPHLATFGNSPDRAYTLIKGNPSGELEWGLQVYSNNYSDPGRSLYYVFSPAGGLGAGSYTKGSITLDSWVNMAGVATCTDAKHGTNVAHRNGQSNISIADWASGNGGAVITYSPGTAPLRIGAWGNYYFPGRIKEVRISKIARSDAWLLTNNYSLKDNLVSFEVSSTPLSVTTRSASDLSTTGAILNADLTSRGTASTIAVSFDYGLTTDYGSDADGIPPTLTNTGAFTASLIGLTPNTQYHYRAKAVGDDTAYGSDQTFTTLDINSPPILSTIGNKTINQDTLLNFTISATDPDSDPLIYLASNLPSGSNFNASTRNFSWTPSSAQVGSYTNVHFQVSDGSLTDSEDITITVSASSSAWDINLDGAVNVLDIIGIGQHWNETGSAGWIREDINKDGSVNTLDSILIGQHWTG
jgi:hypothetical protein